MLRANLGQKSGITNDIADSFQRLRIIVKRN